MFDLVICSVATTFQAFDSNTYSGHRIVGNHLFTYLQAYLLNPGSVRPDCLTLQRRSKETLSPPRLDAWERRRDVEYPLPSQSVIMGQDATLNTPGSVLDIQSVETAVLCAVLETNYLYFRWNKRVWD